MKPTNDLPLHSAMSRAEKFIESTGQVLDVITTARIKVVDACFEALTFGSEKFSEFAISSCETAFGPIVNAIIK